MSTKRQRANEAVELHDRIDHHHQTIETLASLLSCAGRGNHSAGLDIGTVNDAGAIIRHHVRELRELTASLKRVSGFDCMRRAHLHEALVQHFHPVRRAVGFCPCSAAIPPISVTPGHFCARSRI